MNLIEQKNVNVLQFNIFPQEKLFHFSTTIQGGVSQGTYASFNLGLNSGDVKNSVHENRKRLASILDVSPNNLFIPIQTHEDKILIIDESFLPLSENEKMEKLNGIDALITNQKNVCIGVTTADCVPILIYDCRKNILAAIHAGWKGTVAKIAAKTVKKMVDQFGCVPKDLLAGIAPCISQDYFEVGSEVVDAFDRAGFSRNDIAYRNMETEKIHINLSVANKSILIEAGIPSENIEMADLCTFSNPDKFFSARRQTFHSGRMLTGGVLK